MRGLLCKPFFLQKLILKYIRFKGNRIRMLTMLRERKYRVAKDKRDADELVRQYGDQAKERALKIAQRFEKGSREERHWSRIAKVIGKR